jgi:hypothetical protein
MTITDLANVTDGDTGHDDGVRIIRDAASGAVAIVLDATAVDALESYLDHLGAAHDLITDGFDPAGADVILAIRGMLLHR